MKAFVCAVPAMDRKPKIRFPGQDESIDLPDEILRSGALWIDLADQRVAIDGEPVVLQPKVYELLVLLLSQPQRVHTREALFEKLWPQSVVLDANLTTAMSQLRKALTPALRERVRTLPRVGYSWDADVQRMPRANVRDAICVPPESDPARSAPSASPADSAVAQSAVARLVSTRWRWLAWGALALTGLVLGAWALMQRSAEDARPVVLLDEVEIAERRDPRAWMAPMVAESLQQYLQLAPKLRVLRAEESVGVVASRRALGAADGADHRLRVRIAPRTGDAPGLELRASLLSAGRAPRELRVAVGDSGLIPASQQLAAQVLAALTGEDPALQFRAIAPAALREYEAGMRADTMRSPADARAAYERAIALSPGFGSARLRLARVLQRLGHADLAAAQWQAAAQCEDVGPEAQGEARARALALSGRLLEAAAVHEALAVRFPDEPLHRLSGIDALILHGGEALADAQRRLSAYDPRRADLPTRIRLALLEARLHRALGRTDEELAAYTRLAELTTGGGTAMFHADAQLHLGMLHRGRGDSAAARDAYARSAAAFRAAGSEANAQVAELNALLATDARDDESRRRRADTLERFALRATAAGNRETGGQALDAAAADRIALGDAGRARELAERASQWLAGSAPSRRAGPQVTLAWIDLIAGDAQATLRRLDALRPTAGASFDLDVRLLRVQSWMALGEPARAQAEIDAARRDRAALPPSATQRATLACAEVAVALVRGAVDAAASALSACGTAADRQPLGMLPQQAELAALRGDAAGLRRAERAWAEAIGRMAQGRAREAAIVELARFRLEHGDNDGAERLLRSVDADAVTGLPPPVAARYWLNAAVLAAAVEDRSAYLHALSRADDAIGNAPGPLRREHQLLHLADRGRRDRAVLAIQRREAEAAALHRPATRALRLDAQWQDAPDAWHDLRWWRVDPALR